MLLNDHVHPRMTWMYFWDRQSSVLTFQHYSVKTNSLGCSTYINKDDTKWWKHHQHLSLLELMAVTSLACHPSIGTIPMSVCTFFCSMITTMIWNLYLIKEPKISFLVLPDLNSYLFLLSKFRLEEAPNLVPVSKHNSFYPQFIETSYYTCLESSFLETSF